MSDVLSDEIKLIIKGHFRTFVHNEARISKLLAARS
jgi:hypothetical protein